MYTAETPRYSNVAAYLARREHQQNQEVRVQGLVDAGSKRASLIPRYVSMVCVNIAAVGNMFDQSQSTQVQASCHAHVFQDMPDMQIISAVGTGRQAAVLGLGTMSL